MAAQTLTQANPGNNQVIISAIQFGETVAAGRFLYRNTNDGLYYLASADNGEDAAKASGVSVSSGSSGTWGILGIAGTFDVDAVLTAGETYVLALEFDTAHTKQIQLYSDLNSSEYITILGVALSTTRLFLNLNATGVQA